MSWRKNVLLSCLCLFCLGCGPAGIAIGMLEALKNKSADPTSNIPTTVSTLTAKEAPLPTQSVEVNYTLVDPEGDLADVVVEFSLDSGLTWHIALPANGSPPTQGLATSPQGVPHTFQWDWASSLQRLGENPNTYVSTNVKIRVTPLGGTGVSIDKVRIGNSAPQISIYMGPLYSGDVAIQYVLIDGESDRCDIVSLEYRTGTLDLQTQQFTWENTWHSPLSTYTGQPTQDLAASPLGEPNTYVWDSVTDSVGANPTWIQVRLQVRDKPGALSSYTISSPFQVDNTQILNFPPKVEIVSVSYATEMRQVKVVYRLFDTENNLCQIQPEWSEAGKDAYILCQEAPFNSQNILTDGERLVNLDSLPMPTGRLHTFVWNVPEQTYLKGNTWISLRIAASDPYNQPDYTQAGKATFPLHGWEKAKNVSFNTGASQSPNLAIDSQGIVHAVWRDTTLSPAGDIFYSTFDGSRWSAPQKISWTATAAYTRPIILVDANNKVHIAWIAGANGTEEAHYASYNGTNWTTANVSNSPAVASLEVQMTIDANGKVHIIWEEETTPSKIGHRFYNGTTWSGITYFSTPNRESDKPRLAADSSGKVYALWLETGTGATTSDLYYGSFDGVNWTTGFVSGNASPLEAPTLAIDSQSRPHAAWVKVTTTPRPSEIFYSYYNGTAWATPTQVSNPGNSLALGEANRPHLFVDLQSRVHLFWRDSFSGGIFQVAHSFQSDSQWTPPYYLGGSVSLESIQVGVDRQNRLHLVWSDYSTAASNIYYAIGPAFRSQDDGSGTGAFVQQLWSTPIALSELTSSSQTPAMAIHRQSGRVHVLWQDNVSGNEDILHRSFSALSPWSPPYQISNVAATATSVRVAVSTDGVAHFVWQDDELGSPRIQYRSLGASGFSAREPVSPDNGFSPQLAIDDQNIPHAVWISGNDVFYAKRGATGWTTAQLSNSSIPLENPHIAVGTGGKVYVVWQETTAGTTPSEVYVRTYDGSQWQAVVNLSQNTGYSQSPKVVVDGSSKVHALWSDNTTGAEGIYHAISTDGINWTSQRISGTTNNSINFRVVATGNNLHLTWQDSGEIYYTRYNGTTWSVPVNVSNTANDSQWPDIAVDSQGKVHIVWQETISGLTTNIYYAHYNGTIWTKQNLFPSSSSGSTPRVQVDASDRVHILWTDQATGNGDIYYRFFDGTSWSEVQNISQNFSQSINVEFAIGSAGIYAAWENKSTNGWDIFVSLLSYPQPSLLKEDFETVTIPNLPASWTSTGGWLSEQAGKLGSTTNIYLVNSSTSTGGAQILTLPTLDCSKVAKVYLTFDYRLEVGTGGAPKVAIDVSPDGGTTWNPVPGASNTTGSPIWSIDANQGSQTGTVRIELTHYAFGQKQVVIRFRYENSGTAGYFALDNVKVETHHTYERP